METQNKQIVLIVDDSLLPDFPLPWDPVLESVCMTVGKK